MKRDAIMIAIGLTILAWPGYWLLAPVREHLPTTERVLDEVAFTLVLVPRAQCESPRPLSDFPEFFDPAAFNALLDEWRHTPVVQCHDGKLEVRSAGRDGQYHTGDDIVVTRDMP